MTVIGVGVDLVDVSDFRKRVKRNPKFLGHVFSSAEKEWCEAYFDPGERYSARFAAKEAFYKALPFQVQNKIDWKDIEIVPGPNGKPEVLPSEKCHVLLKQIGVERVLLSLSQESGMAISFIVLCGLPAQSRSKDF
jgi:holo-[acyl-carrier protein] synthase